MCMNFIVALLAAVTVHTATLETIENDSPIVTNVTATADIDTNAVKQISGDVTSNVVTKAYVEGLGISAGLTTNSVKSIIETEVGGTNTIAHIGDKVAWSNVTNAPDFVERDANYMTVSNRAMLAVTNEVDPTATAKAQAAIAAARCVSTNEYGIIQLHAEYNPGIDFHNSDSLGISWYKDYVYVGDSGNSYHFPWSSEYESDKARAIALRSQTLDAIGGDYGDGYITLDYLYFSDDSGFEGDKFTHNNSIYSWDGGSVYLPWSSEYGLDYTHDIALRSQIPTTADQVGAASVASLNAVSNTMQNWENYWHGDKVRISVTNYYGNTSGEPPRMRIEEFDHSITNGNVVSNVFRVVWDELTRHTNYYSRVDSKVNAISNTVLSAAWRQTNLQLLNKAPRAWGTVTSAGADAPEGTVWHTEPNTVFAGGTEYAHVAVGEGMICVLSDNGAPVFTEGEEGKFRFKDDSGQYYFGFDVRDSYTIGCRTDNIYVDTANHIVSLTYDLTSASNPEILHCTNLLVNSWSVAPVTWEQNPPAGTKVCYIDVGSNPRGFYKAQISYAGGAKFVTNMQVDMLDGIAASNQTLNVIQSVYPVIINNTVQWRVR